MLVLVSSNDLGSALLYFGIFLAMLYVATARLSFVVGRASRSSSPAASAPTRRSPHVHERVTIWLHPWTTQKVYCPPTGGLALRQDCQSYQLVKSLYSIANGGFGGTGLGKGTFTTTDGHAADPVRQHATSSTRRSRRSSGSIGAAALLLVFMLFVARGMKIALQADDGFSKLLAAGPHVRLRAADVHHRRRRPARDPADRDHAAVRLLRRLVRRRELPAARGPAPRLQPREREHDEPADLPPRARRPRSCSPSLIVATTYWQTWAAPGLAAKQDNAIQRVAQFRIRRGLIYAADGKTVLAANRRREERRRRRSTSAATRRTASRRRRSATRRRAASRAGIEREENAYLTASNANLGTIFDKLSDKLKGTTVTGNNLVLNLRAGAQRLAETALAGKCGAAVVLNPKTGAVYVMASSPTYDPNLIESTGATRASCNSPSAVPRLGVGAPEPRDAGPLPAGLDVQDRHRRRGARRPARSRPTRRFYDPGYCIEYGKQVYNAGNRPERRRRRSATSTFLQAYEHSINAVFCNVGMKLGAKTILDKAKDFGFYSTPPLELPPYERRAERRRTTSRTHGLGCSTTPASIDPGRLAFGQEQAARDAAADGARRGRRSRTAARHGAAPRQEGDGARRAARSSRCKPRRSGSTR